MLALPNNNDRKKGTMTVTAIRSEVVESTATVDLTGPEATEALALVALRKALDVELASLKAEVDGVNDALKAMIGDGVTLTANGVPIATFGYHNDTRVDGKALRALSEHIWLKVSNTKRVRAFRLK